MSGHSVSFELGGGSERKATGSYYTPDELVQELIKSALEPVIGDRLAEARNSRAALLGIRVCDPACGSGHFLLAAARRLARELARIDSGQREPGLRELDRARREVIRHCIYGVDLNPLAVDLCKLALWIEGHVPGTALAFLDHRIKGGNSLIGATPAILEAGIPDEAFEAVTGDDKKMSSALKKRNRLEHKQAQQLTLFGDAHPVTADEDEVLEAMLIDDLPDDSTIDTGTKQARYESLAARLGRKQLVADMWATAFFWTLKEGEPPPPTQLALQSLRRGGNPLSSAQLAHVAQLAEQNRVFHWHLEFPEVFGEDGQGGFDCVLGNPPWEQIQLDAREYFQNRLPEIANAQHMADRDKAIAHLATSHPEVYAEFARITSTFEKTQLYFHNSGRFPLTSYGRLNSAPLFAEMVRQIVARRGRVGIVLPTGIATDSFNQYIFADLVEKQSLVSLFGLKNEEFLFSRPVEHTVTFALFTVLGADLRSNSMEFTWLAYNTRHMNDPARRHTLTAKDIALLNPNTKTCPVFRTRADAELTKVIYRRIPVLVNESAGAESDPWVFKGLLMFMMNTGSVLFRTAKQLMQDGWVVDGNIYRKGQESYLPLYEAKLMHQFDHRWASYDGADARDLTVDEKADPHCTVTPRYWVPRAEVESRLAGRWGRDWLLAWRDIARNTDERTSIFCILPRVGVGHTAPLMLLAAAEPCQVTALLANMNVLVLDYATRQKIGGTHLTYGYLKQFPVLPPTAYTSTDLEFIVPRVLELVYTAWDMQPFARDLGYEGPPFAWDEERRARLRAELDAYYARLYGLTRKQLRYILDPHSLTDRELADILDPAEDPPDAPRTRDFPGETFRVLKQREIKEYGEYRTQRLVLAAWERLEGPDPPAPGIGIERAVAR